MKTTTEEIDNTMDTLIDRWLAEGKNDQASELARVKLFFWPIIKGELNPGHPGDASNYSTEGYSVERFG